MHAVQTMLNIFQTCYRTCAWLNESERYSLQNFLKIFYMVIMGRICSNISSVTVMTVRIDNAHFQDKNKQAFKGKHFLSNRTNSKMKRNPPSASPP